MHATTVAIDLAKDVFELAIADQAGRVIRRERLNRGRFGRVVETLPACRMVMEAGGGAHYWARRFQAAGHQVVLLPGQYVKPYRRRNKTDRADCMALLEAAKDGGDQPDKQLFLVPGAVSEAGVFLEAHDGTHSRFDRVAELVQGFETSFGLELLTTVHWVVSKEHADSREEVVAATYAWGDRKRQFSPTQIGIALDRLIDNGWREKH